MRDITLPLLTDHSLVFDGDDWVSKQASSNVERLYNKEDDRLFLVYYALPPGFNQNNWGVSDSSLPVNIKTAINKPVIIYRKNPNNPFHTKQAGNFVHPTPQEAAAEIGKLLSEPEYYQWQEKHAIGRIRDVEQRGDKGYAWTLEITDPDAKRILRSDDYKNGIPGWTSPQILTYPNVYPNEERTGVHDHWIVSHVILTDRPAYGLDKASLKAKCLGAEQECLIKTKNASQENIGFCVKQATIDLIDSRSSQKHTENTSLHNTMSQTETPQPNPNNEVVATKTLSEQNQKQEGEQQAPPAGSGIGVEGDAKERERSQQEEEPQAPVAKSLDEANALIKKLLEQGKAKDEMLKSQQKDMKSFQKWKEQIEDERRTYMLKSVIPRDLFKSEDSHNKEVDRIKSKGLDSDIEFLKGHYDLMRQARLAQENIELKAPIPRAKSASLDIATQYQPQDDNTQANNLSSTIERELNLPRKMFGGTS